MEASPPHSSAPRRRVLSPKEWHRRIRAALQDTWKQMAECQLFSIASALAYSTLLSIIPLLAVSFSVLKAFGGMEQLFDAIEPIIFRNLAEGVDDKALETIRSFITNIHAGAIGGAGFIGLIFTSMSLMNSADTAIQRVWKTGSNRPFLRRVMAYWFILTLGPIALAIGVTLTPRSDSFLLSLASNFVSYGLAAALLTAMYKLVPNRPVKLRPALIAGLAAAVGFQIAKLGYGLYVRKLAAYGKIYGSLGAIPIFLLWIYVIWLVLLTGVALSAALQRRIEERT